ncbi:MAG: sigma 54-interacting transcriptional regulator [Syntrophales bacterium]|nr:sigma 54-interacting transcriptional regulator [Syntrophales bacterium]
MKKPGIMELINSLDHNELGSIQMAALLGDNFGLDHILAIADIKPSKLIYLFDKLIRANIIGKVTRSDSVTYCFRNKSFFNVISESIDEEKRISYCTRLIDCLENDDIRDRENVQSLANLYLQYGEKGKRFQYMKKAADLLMSAHYTESALTLYKKIIDALLGKNRDQLETVILIDSVISYAPIIINMNPPANILQIVNQAILLADELANKRAKVMLGLCLGGIYEKEGKFLEAGPQYNKSWVLAQELEDVRLIKSAAKLYALSLFWQGLIEDAIQVYESALENVEEISLEEEISLNGLRDIWSYLMLAWSYGITGRIGRGLGLAEAVRKIAVSKGDLKTQAFAHGTISLIFLGALLCDQAEPHINATIEIGEKINSDLALFMSKPGKAYLEMLKGNLESAKELINQSRALQLKLGQRNYSTSLIFEVYLALHKKWNTVGDDSLSLLMKRTMSQHSIYVRGIALRYKAISIGMYKGNLDTVEMLLRESLELLEKSGSGLELGKTQIQLAKLYLENMEPGKAKEFANSAYNLLSEINAALFPPELNFLIEEKTKELQWEHGVSELEAAIQFVPDYEKYLGKVVEILTNMFGAERAAILMMKEEGSVKELHVAARCNFSSEDIGLFQTAAMRSLISQIMHDLKPLIISGDGDNRILLQLSKEQILIKSLVVIPLIVAKKMTGVIYLDNRLLEGIFAKQDMTIMKAIATQISLASKVTILFEQLGMPESNNHDAGFDQPKRGAFKANFGNIIGESKAINDVLLNAKKVAQTKATVLIYGETGVGKELLAHAIHKLSDRSNKPFIVVNISALNENLTTSELFGYEKGAYTGALKTSPGRFEIADGGTIFLDEIGELSQETQVKLLRVLQDHKFERVGSTRTISSDFRLIAATNKNLHQKIATGEFRSDLFFRISSFPIEIPPLRDRKEDIPPLAFHFMAIHSSANNKNITRIPASEMKKLLNHSWPGNVRELDNIIEKAVILSDGDALTIQFPDHSSQIVQGERRDFGLVPLSEIERTHIMDVLNYTRWRIRGDRGAAKILGLKPTTLEFRIKKLGISRHD